MLNLQGYDVCSLENQQESDLSQHQLADLAGNARLATIQSMGGYVSFK